MDKEKRIYDSLIEMIYELEEQGKEIREKIVAFVLYNLSYNRKLLESPEISERLDVLVDTSNVITSTLETIMCVVTDAHQKKDLEVIGQCYKEILKILNFYGLYEGYFDLLVNYQLCLEDHDFNVFAFQCICENYDDYIECILKHFDLVVEEKQNNSLAKEEEMKLVRKDRQLVRLSRKYLNMLEK